jgi:hypothetical protein
MNSQLTLKLAAVATYIPVLLCCVSSQAKRTKGGTRSGSCKFDLFGEIDKRIGYIATAQRQNTYKTNTHQCVCVGAYISLYTTAITIPRVLYSLASREFSVNNWSLKLAAGIYKRRRVPVNRTPTTFNLHSRCITELTFLLWKNYPARIDR